MSTNQPSVKRADIMDLVGGTPGARNPLWAALHQGFDTVMQRNVDEPQTQLRDIRFLRENFDRAIFERTCRMLGFDISQDVLDLQTDLTKLTTQLPLYADYNGTYLFEKFVELLLNGECEVQHLWAEIFPEDKDNYYNWTNVPQLDESKLVYRGGTWVRTTHIDLYIGLGIGATSLDNIVLNPGQTLLQRVIDLFFEYAPVALVIRQFWFLIKVNALIRVGVDIPTEGFTAFLKILMDPPIIIPTGMKPGTRLLASGELTEDYVDAKVLTFTGPDSMRAQMAELDSMGFPLAVLAARSVQEAQASGSAQVNLSTLPNFPVRPTDQLTGPLIATSVSTPFGTLSFDYETSEFLVESDANGFTIYAKVHAYVLDTVQWQRKVWITVVTHYSASGVADQVPSYFIHKSVVTQFSNFRLKTNGLIFSSLEHP